MSHPSGTGQSPWIELHHNEQRDSCLHVVTPAWRAGVLELLQAFLERRSTPRDVVLRLIPGYPDDEGDAPRASV
jgi:hypothetical protein